MNIHPSDGNNLGWGPVNGTGGWPTSGSSLGTPGSAFGADFVDSDVWASASNFVAVVRHSNGVCSAVKVWKLSSQTTSMFDYFRDGSPHQNEAVSYGGPVYSVTANTTTDEPIFGEAASDGELVFNWRNEGQGAARITVSSGLGLGNMANVTGNSSSETEQWGPSHGWHDAASHTLGTQHHHDMTIPPHSTTM